jgi:hypothetical protein
MIGSAVALLQADPTLDRLQIDENRLGLDWQRPGTPRDDGIPGSQVAFDWQGHLRPPAKVRGEVTSESFEQANLPGIPDWIAGRVGADPDVESDDRPDGAQLTTLDALDLPMFEVPDPSMIDTGRMPDGSQAQARADAGSTKLLRDSPQVGLHLTSTAIRGSFPNSHGSILGSAGSRRLISGVGVVTVPTTDRRNARISRDRERRLPPVGPWATSGALGVDQPSVVGGAATPSAENRTARLDR